MEGCLTVYNNTLLKTRFTRITDQEEDINEPYKSDLSIPPRAVDEYVPRVNITYSIRICSTG